MKKDFRELVVNGSKAKASGWLTLDYSIQKPTEDTPKNVGKNGSEAQLQYGLSISRKIGSAVVRNKLKRWSREFFRKVTKNSELPIKIKLNLRLRENGAFYKNLKHAEFEETLGKAWTQIKKQF